MPFVGGGNLKPNYLVFDNEHSSLVNALPYLDESVEDDPTLKTRVNQLIKEEMSRMGGP